MILNRREDAMKKRQAKNKLTLNIETIRHLKHLTLQDLGQVQGASGTCSGCDPECTSTKVQDGP
jgi:hypothetical protein